MKNCYIYGSHVKVGYTKKYSTFSDLYHEGMSRSKTGIEYLVSKSKKPVYNSEIPIDDIGFRRNLNLFSEYHFGNPYNHLVLGITYHKLTLMNDEVVWRWKTGSVLCYRFENRTESLKFFEHCLATINIFKPKIRKIETLFQYEIGDNFQLLDDITVPFYNYTYHKGEIFRVYDCDNSYVIPTGEDNKTLIRIPNTGGAKNWIGYCKIPLNLTRKI